jgi:undecaprenyl phosphate-alpha-L-ara4FN deformylase
MKLIALKIDVDTALGIRGLPKLVELLQSRSVGATFFWSLGLEKNGLFLRPARGLRKMQGASYIPLRQRYGFAALLLGSLRPSRGLKKLAEPILASLDSEQFEHGIRAANRYQWQKNIIQLDSEQTEQQYQQALGMFEKVMGVRPIAHAAQGWQMNRTSFRLHQLNGLQFASDCRGSSPFWPVVQGEYLPCLQIPVNLPMLEELLPQMSIDAALEFLQQATAQANETGHVFNIAADFDAQYLEHLTRLIDYWLAEGYSVVPMGALQRQLDIKLVPYHHVAQATWPGRYGQIGVQGQSYP